MVMCTNTLGCPFFVLFLLLHEAVLLACNLVFICAFLHFLYDGRFR